jgi:CheY-like chemotaxis protein
MGDTGGTGLRVLVIEDNHDAAETLRDLLALFGHQAEIAPTGQAGIDLARRRPPNVVLCDIGLPEMDGYAVARKLRADPQTALIRLVALTGYGRESDQRRAAEAGFDVHLVKPVEPELLKRLLAGFAEGGPRLAGPGDLQPQG